MPGCRLRRATRFLLANGHNPVEDFFDTGCAVSLQQDWAYLFIAADSGGSLQALLWGSQLPGR